jgi:hypothetical protein
MDNSPPPKSISVMATGAALREVQLLIFSIRMLYNSPIYVVCDDTVYTKLKRMGFLWLYLKAAANPEDLKAAAAETKAVVAHNDFHSAGAIWAKIGAMEWALAEEGETLFLDADIVFNNTIHEDIVLDVDAIVSPHYHTGDTFTDSQKYGVFNAGYVFARHPDFAKVWKDIYLNRSTFYEQQGMIWLFEHFDMGIFNKNHNIGFWRFTKDWSGRKLSLGSRGINWSEAKSFHFHAFPETYTRANKGLTRGYNLLKEEMVKQLTPELQKVYRGLT